MTRGLTGGCQCGAVRYRIAGALGRSSLCHCRMCQRATGNAFAPLVLAEQVSWQGTPARWASSDVSERGFCARCGTPLFLRDFDARDGVYEIMTGTLDDAEACPPDHHYGIESRLGWLAFNDALPAYRTGAGDGRDPATITSYQDTAHAVKEDL